MLKLMFIVPYPEIKDTVADIFEKKFNKNEIKLDIIPMSVEKVAEVDFSDIDADVIAARGYSAALLKEKKLDIPVVTINISVYDAIATIDTCILKYNSRKIGFVGYYTAFMGLEKFSKYFGCDIKVYSPKEYMDVEKAMRRSIEDGCDTIVGGYTAEQTMQKYSFSVNFELIKTGEETVYNALSEAVRTAEAIRNERIKAGMYQIITQSAPNGILYVENNGVIQVSNPEAQRITKTSLNGKRLENVIPHAAKSFREAIECRKIIETELITINDVTLSVSYTPVMDKNNVAGVVIRLENVTKVQHLEGMIRQKLSKKGLFAKYTFNDILHKSAIIDETISMAKLYALSNSNIMIVGETGTGKELFAQSIHNAGLRKSGPFVAVNCAALPENLLESELFGYVGGAFTGAEKKGKTGLFELAHNGTIFLDEIGEISLNMQSKLLRVIQEKEIRRIGDDGIINVDVRIICATNKNLEEMTKNGLFRQDLFYRLDVLRIYIPPLRKRSEDIPLIFDNFIREISGGRKSVDLSEDAKKLLKTQELLGNVRELRNVAERAFVIKKNEDIITREDLERAMFPEGKKAPEHNEKLNEKEDMPFLKKTDDEKEKILKVIEECEGNKTKAAEILKMDRSTLWRKIKKYNIVL